MHALIVFAHPEPRSFNGALKDAAARSLRDAGHTVEVSDLYGEGFDPAERAEHYRPRTAPDAFSPLVEQREAWRQGTLPADVRREIQRLERADLVILQFPIWWHGPPAMLKGWFDRVFVSGGLYTSRMRYDRGYFRGRRAVVSATIGAPPSVLVPGGRGGALDALLWPVQYSLYYMGFSVLPASKFPSPAYRSWHPARRAYFRLQSRPARWGCRWHRPAARRLPGGMGPAPGRAAPGAAHRLSGLG